MNIKDWYKQTTHGDSVNLVAENAQVSQSTLSRQVNSGKFSADIVVSVARKYGTSPLRALVILGLLSQEDIDAHYKRIQLAEYTDVELAREIACRLEASDKEERSTVLDVPPSLSVIEQYEDAAAMDEAYDPRHDEDQPSPDDE